jgi:integrase
MSKTTDRIKLTWSRVNAITPPKHGDRLVYDTVEPKLCVRVTNTGKRSYYLYRRIHGKVRKLRIDAVENITVEQARRVVQQMNGRIAEGKTPREERRMADGTLAEVFAEYMEQHSKPKKRSWRDDQGLYNRYLKKPFGHLPLDALDVERIRALHADVGRRAPVGANRMLALLSKVFTFTRGRNAINPCRDVERFAESERKRRMTTGELPRFFTALDKYEAETGDDTGADLLRTLLLSGQRRDNVRKMRWLELDLEARTWTIPGTNFKNKQPHVAALPESLVAIFLLRKARYGNKQYVFPGKGGRGYRVDLYKAWYKVLEHAGIDKSTIRIHDLRATLATMMAENGETLEAIARQMGHRSYQTTRRYMRLGQEAVRSAVDRTAAVMAGSCRNRSA